MAHITSTGDQWKELAAQGKNIPAGPAVQTLVAHVNQIWPFSNASGILDIGCGTGAIVSHILDTHGEEIPSPRNIIATDFSEHMLDVLRDKQEAKREQSAAWAKLQLLNVDAHDLSRFDEGSFSLVTGGHVFFLLDDFQKALNETHRVLRRDGLLAITSGYQADHMDALSQAIETVRPGTNAVFIREPWNNIDGIANLLKECGFVDIEITVQSGEMKYESHNDFSRMLLLMPVMKNITESYEDDERQRLLKALIHELERLNPAAPGVLRSRSIMAIARKQ